MNIFGESIKNTHDGDVLIEGDLTVTGAINGDSSGLVITNNATGNTTSLATQATSNYNFDFPADMGSAGQCLVTDGSQNTSWVTISSVPGANDWNIGGNALTSAGSMGSTTAYDVDFVCNSNNFIKLDVNNDDIKLYRSLVSTAGARLGNNLELFLTGNSLLVGLKASASTTGAYTITLPPDQATAAGQKMTNDGSGNLSWADGFIIDSTGNNLYASTTSITGTGTQNVLLSARSPDIINGIQNTIVGDLAASNMNPQRSYNTVLGAGACPNLDANSNTVFGRSCGDLSNPSAGSNCIFGYNAGQTNSSGGGNAHIGAYADTLAIDTEKSVGIGYGAHTSDYSVTVGGGTSTDLPSVAKSGTSSVAVGFNADATGVESVSIGYETDTSSDNCVVIGSNASATGQGGIAIGYMSGATLDSVCIGASAWTGTGDNNTCVGSLANIAVGGYTNSTAIGHGAMASASNEVVLGGSAVTKIRPMGTNVVFGDDTNYLEKIFSEELVVLNSAGTSTCQIQSGSTGNWILKLPANGGTNNHVLTTDGSGITSWTAKGGGSSSFNVDGSDNINGGTGNLSVLGIGARNQVIGIDSAQALTTGNDNTIMGRQTGNVITTGSSNILIGNSCETTKVDLTESVGVGYLANIDNDYAVAIGSRPTAGADGSIAIGKNANASTAYAVAIGRESDSTSVSTVSIGNYSDSSGTNGVSVGNGATSVENSVSVGGVANSGVNGTAIGYSSLVIGGGTAVGYDSTSNSTGVAVGNSAGANDNSVAIGRSASNSGSYSIAIGDSVTTSANQLKIGDATNTYENFIYGGQIHKTDLLTDSQTVNHRASKYLLHGSSASQVFTLGTPENGYTATFFSYGGNTFQIDCGVTNQLKDGSGATTYRYANFPSAIGASLTVTFYGTYWYVSSVNNVTFS